MHRGSISTVLRGVDGDYRAAYSAHSTSPVVDDVGEATLVAGSSFVAIDSALAASIDVTHGYLVFLTAQGATPGLYVSNKTRTGFTVREIGGARDSIPFDYRIVARPYGDTGRRLAVMPASIRSATTATPLYYRHLKPLRFLGGKLDRSSLPKPSMWNASRRMADTCCEIVNVVRYKKRTRMAILPIGRGSR